MIELEDIPQFALADGKTHYTKGWVVKYNPSAKAYPYTAWRYRGSSTHKRGVKAKRRIELVAKMQLFEERLASKTRR